MAKKGKSKQPSKNFNVLIIVLAFIFILGGVVGYFVGSSLIKNDKFTINGESTIEIFVGQTYQDEGATAISFGKDVSDKIKTESDLDWIEEGQFYTSAEEGQYYLKYTVNNIRYKGVERYRTIIVKPLEEEGKVGVQYEER